MRDNAILHERQPALSEPAKTVVYEAPLNERIRTFLRLEDLFAQYEHAQQDTGVHGMRAMLRVLIDILTLLSKSDYKSEILKELGEQHAALSRLAARDDINTDALSRVLGELEQAINALQDLGSQFVSSALRDNEFLLSVQNRFTLPGGTCSFDVPSLHHWLHRPAERVRRDLAAWYADIDPFATAIRLYLRMLRQSTDPVPVTATSGMYVETPNAPYQLVRAIVAQALDGFPEISAGRHRFTIRFMQIRDINQPARQIAADIPFMLQRCVL